MKTIAEINEKIKKGKAVIVTAEEIIDLAKKKGIKKTAREVDVVTTATFSPMCSSGAYFNIGPTKPKVRLGGGKVCLNDIPCYGGFAAAIFFLALLLFPRMIQEIDHIRENFAMEGGISWRIWSRERM